MALTLWKFALFRDPGFEHTMSSQKKTIIKLNIAPHHHLKCICHEPDWFTRYNSLYCSLKSTGSRLNFVATEIHEAEMKGHKTMEFHPALLGCIKGAGSRNVNKLLSKR